jgi:hypothetical protein
VEQAVVLAGPEERKQDSMRYNEEVAQAVGLAETEERNSDSLRHMAVAAVITFVVVATGFLLRPEGFGAALRLLPAWLGQFSAPSLPALRALLGYEPAVLLLGLPAIIWALLAHGRRARPLVVWLAGLLLIVLLQPEHIVNAAAVTLPAYWLVGLFAAALAVAHDATRANRSTTFFVAGTLVGLGALLLAVIGRLARLGLLNGQNGTLIGLASLAFVLAALAVVVALAWDSSSARRGAFVGLAALLLFWQWGAARQLSRVGANDPREQWVSDGTAADAREMVTLLTRISRQAANSDRDLTIFSQVDSPVLRWYLRDFPGYRAGAAVPVDAAADVVITPADAEPLLSSDYFGADFGLEQREIAAGPRAVADALRWWLFRESNLPVETQRVVVWVRSDLAGGE